MLPGGGDWLVERADGVRQLDVRITLSTDDGALIYAHYPGLFHAAPGVMDRLLRGEPVDPSEYYFRTAPMFETSAEKYAWLNRVLAIGIGRRTSRQVCYTVYAVLYGNGVLGQPLPTVRIRRQRTREARDVFGGALGQCVGGAGDALEPTVDIALQNARGVRHDTRLA